MSNTSVNRIKDMIGTVPLYFPDIQSRSPVLMTFSYHIIIDANNQIILGTFTISIFLHKMWVNLITNLPSSEIEVWTEYTGAPCGG